MNAKRKRAAAATATGRILIWRGGSLWIGRGGVWKAHEAFIVAAQQRHEFDAREQRVAQLFVEP